MSEDQKAAPQTTDYGGYGEGQPFLCVECEDAPPMRGFTVCKQCWDEIAHNEPPGAAEMDEVYRG